MGSPDLFFFYQCDNTRKVPRRYRKLPEELPESLRFAHLNPKVAALLASKEHSKHKLDNEDPFGDGLGKKSLLPDINSAFTNVRNQFDSALSNDEDSQRYLFEEAKMSAQTVLEQLSRIIYYYEDLHKHIPKSLEYQLMNSYVELTNDITIVPREWQTQEMKEQHVAKMQQEPNSDEEYSDTEAFTMRTKSRFGVSERSGSEACGKQNVKKPKSKLGTIDGNEDVEINIVKAESRAGRRSESRLSAAGSQMKQFDIGNLSRVGSRRKGSSVGSHRSISGMSPATQLRGRDNFLSSFVNETPSDARCIFKGNRWKAKIVRATALANPLSYMQTINFQLSNKQFEDKGWIMLKGREEEVDQSAVLEYCMKVLQESMKQIEFERKKEIEQGFDKPVIVRYYGDTKKETLLKYRKSPVKSSTSPVIKGYKPRIPSINDEKNEGKKLMQASHIDGTTFIYYPSGRPAVVHSAAGFGRPGFYTIAYEDGLDSRMLACFTPSGRGVCYHDNGIVRFLATEKGGHLAEQDGALIRKWKWPQSNVKIIEPINFQINSHLSLRCVNQVQMGLLFSCQRETARFTVSPVPDAEDYKGSDESDHLLTAFTFSSRAAKDLMRLFNPNKKAKKKSRKQSVSIEENNEDRKTDEEDKICDDKMAGFVKQVAFAKRMSLRPTFTLKSRRLSLVPEMPETLHESRQRKSLSMVTGSISPVTRLFPRNPADCRNKNEDENEPKPTEGRSMSARRQSVTPDLKQRGSMVQELDEAAKRAQSAKNHDKQRTKDGKAGKVKNRPLTSSKVASDKSSEGLKTMTKNPGLTDRCMILGEDEKKKTNSKHAHSKQQENPHKDKVDAAAESAKSDQDTIQIVTQSVAEVLAAFPKSNRKLSSKTGSKLRASMSLPKCTGEGHSEKHRQTTVNLGELNKGSRSAVQINVETPTNNDLSDTENDATDKESDKGEDTADEALSTDDDESGDMNEKDSKSESLTRMSNDVPENHKTADETNIEGKFDTLLAMNALSETDLNVEGLNEAALNSDKDETRYESSLENTDNADQKAISSDKTCAKDKAKITEAWTEPNETELKMSVSRKSIGDRTEADNEEETDMVMELTVKSSNSVTEQNSSEENIRAKQGKRRKSSLMKSIYAYRKMVLSKKGIVLSSDSSEEETDEDEDKSKSQTSEIIKLLADFPERVTYEIEADKELARLQRKARNLVDDWMEHYRIAVGLASLSLQSLKDTPSYDIHKRNIKSARHSEQQVLIRKAVMGIDEFDEMPSARRKRIASAPLAGLGKHFDDDEDERSGSPERLGNTVTFDEQKTASGEGTASPTAMAVMSRLAESAGRQSARSARSTRASSARSSPCRASGPQPQQDAQLQGASTASSRSHCPLVIRQQHLGYERPQCRCSRHQIPFIMDIELDDFVATETPEGQLICIMVVSSLKNLKNRTEGVDYSFYVTKQGKPYHRVFPGVTQAEEMLNEIYVNQNRNRTRPCVQSRSDMFRVFKYDINSAAEMSDRTQPLLLTRHNVVPGMILIYCDGKLLFCDHIFNGYGNTRKDFKKQIMKSRHDSIQGFSLPKDFRFSPGRGKSGWRSAWGGEIGGAGIDKYSSTGTVLDTSLHPIQRPSSSTSSEHSKEVHLDTIKLEQAALAMSLSSNGLPPATPSRLSPNLPRMQPV